jgi:peptidylprolyl isomerase/FKBP-type peptidyl-prolyl cis-trans isomerase FklB
MRKLMILAAAVLALAACQAKTAGPDQSAESKAFMAKVLKEPGVRVLPSGVAYKIVRSGPANGIRPQPQDEVKVHYEGKLVNGRVFDSSYERGQPAAMPLKGLIPAWQEALPLMRPGDEWVLYVPPEKGYGAEGAGGGEIPPNAALIFRIELIDVLPGPGHILQG